MRVDRVIDQLHMIREMLVIYMKNNRALSQQGESEKPLLPGLRPGGHCR